MSTYRHAVIISSYNRPKMVREAIQSVLMQRASVQLIVADDDSDAETRSAIADEIRGRSNCILLAANRSRVEMPNVTQRATACINDALAHVDAEFVHYLPDDDWFASGRFYTFERFFDATPDAAIAYGRMFTVDHDSGELTEELFLNSITNRPVDWVDHGQFCHRAHVLERVPAWPATPHYAFDANFFIALVEAGYVFHPVNETVNYKRAHARNLMGEGNRDQIPEGRE